MASLSHDELNLGFFRFFVVNCFYLSIDVIATTAKLISVIADIHQNIRNTRNVIHRIHIQAHQQILRVQAGRVRVTRPNPTTQKGHSHCGPISYCYALSLSHTSAANTTK